MEEVQQDSPSTPEENVVIDPAPVVEVQDETTADKTIKAAVVASKTKKRRSKTMGLYMPALITQKIPISIVNIGDNIKQTLERVIAHDIEGKCIVEGYVKPGSCRVRSYSSGECVDCNIIFEVVTECQVCLPVEGMHIRCIVKNITESAGIKAEVDEDPSPVVIYIARDHHFDNPKFNKVKVGDTIMTRVIGQRFELNDTYISIIAELIEDRAAKYGKRKKKKIVIADP